MKNVALIFLYMTGFIFLLSPIFAVYRYSGDSSILITVPLTHWAVSSILWEQQFDKRKTLMLWGVLSVLLVIFCLLRDRMLVLFGLGRYYHSISTYIYIGLSSTLYFALLETLKANQKKKSSHKENP